MELEPHPIRPELPTHGTYPLTFLERPADSKATIVFSEP
jgi:hypothetical protein